jgi:prolyl oligopeptidase
MAGPVGADHAPLAYPPAPRVEQVDDYHGTLVSDPYRWMEELDAPAVQAWVAAENAVTEAYLQAIPERDAIQQRLTRMVDYERYDTPTKRASYYFYEHNDGLQNQNALYVQDGVDGQPRLLLDPNTLSEDGSISVPGWQPSRDGRLLAYAISVSGSDLHVWRVRDVNSGADLPDRIVTHSGDVSWLPDGSGFYYQRFPESPDGDLQALHEFPRIYWHRLDTPQAADLLAYDRPDQRDWSIGAAATDDGRYLILAIRDNLSDFSQLFYKDLHSPNSPAVELITGFDARYSFVGNDGPIFYVQTDLDAPRYRLVAVDLAAPERSNWREVVPEADEAINSVKLAGNFALVSYLQDARALIRVFTTAGDYVRDVTLPDLGTVWGLDGLRDDLERFYAFNNYTTPTTIYRYDVPTGRSTVWRQARVDLDLEAYETRQVFYQSKDGTRVPMFISHRKGLILDGTNPTYLYGYGGFSIPMQPHYAGVDAVWMEMGGVYAVANLRGGGEYGGEWYEAGTKLQKQNVFDDFIAAAEWLIGNGYTTPARLAIGGESNGGLLVGAVLNQRPDLFGAALPAVGVMDMLRYHLFGYGRTWLSDYGSPDDPAEFAALYAYSPLHNIGPGTVYPPTLILTAESDDRVTPAHSFKYAATLQAAQPGPAPILLHVETKAGHGAGTALQQQIATDADRLAFMLHNLRRSPRGADGPGAPRP